MMTHFTLLAEVLATILCIYSIYGRKFKVDLQTMITILCLLCIIEAANTYGAIRHISFLNYMILFFFCRIRFKSPYHEAFISLILCGIIETAIEFLSAFAVSCVVRNDTGYRNFFGSILTLLLIWAVSRSKCVHRIQRSMCKKTMYVTVLIGFSLFVILIMILQWKIRQTIEVPYFVLAVPAVFLLLYSVLKWSAAKDEAEQMKEQYRSVKEGEKDYDDLLKHVRLRQHNFKNHITAIFSSHYTCKTYEELVRAQEKYCAEMLADNKYNDLLIIGDKVFAGYLYRKFQEMTEAGMEIRYKISAKLDSSRLPAYHLIEMVGILLDNAVEASKSVQVRKIFFEVSDEGTDYVFGVRNPYPYVTYDEMLQWFAYESSKKGRGRGLGLYQLKQICQEKNCEIECRNRKIDQCNWIQFMIKVPKADNMQ